jgi:hypothetical protein
MNFNVTFKGCQYNDTSRWQFRSNSDDGIDAAHVG